MSFMEPICCVRRCELAVLPKKAGENEVGYDLTIIKKVKEIDPYTIMYDTGIIVKPPQNHYIEIIARSSIVKSGWILANSVGVIDPTYRDTLKVVLKRVDLSQPEVELPSKICQLVLRKMESNIPVKEVYELDETERTGGFGSTSSF